MNTELCEFDKLVDEIREKDQKENVFTALSKEDIHSKWQGLSDLLDSMKENLDEFVKLASALSSVR